MNRLYALSRFAMSVLSLQFVLCVVMVVVVVMRNAGGRESAKARPIIADVKPTSRKLVTLD